MMKSFTVPFAENRAQPNAAKTLALDVYERLRADIRSGILNPGSPLRVEWLKNKYVIGATPLREALSRLAAEHLVTTEGKRGFRVAPVSLAEFKELTSLRDNIERQAIEMAVRLGDDEWESKIVACFHKLSKAPPAGQSHDVEIMEERDIRHDSFHHALIAGCGSTWLLRLWHQMLAHQERYRRIATRDVQTPKNIAQDIEAEHRAIMEAVLARNDKEAGHLLWHHQRRTIAHVEAWAKENGL